MRHEITNWNQSQIGKYLQQQNIEWHFNPPTSSHFGGYWERLIRSVRRVMYSLLRGQCISLDDASLQTLMCEVEQILNNRPLTPVSEDPHDLDVLTPNHLLLRRANDSFPPGVFIPADSYVKRKWCQVQYLVNFGQDGPKSIFRYFRRDRSGLSLTETSPLEILSLL